MEKSNPAAGGSEHPAATTGGDSPDAASPGRPPVSSFGRAGVVASPAGVTDKGVTLNVRCRLTIRNGTGLLGGADTGGPHIGGADVGGPHIGGGDNSGGDLVVEFEGSASLGGGSGTFGGADVGGPHIGGADTGGPRIGGAYEGGRRRQVSAPRAYEAGEAKGGSKAR